MYVFPKKVALLITAKQNERYDLLHRCITPQLSLLLFRFVAFHYDMKFIAAFFFFKGFSAKQQKKPKKKEIITALQSECIMRQLYGKYYKMFASKNDRSKWRARREVDRSSPRSGRHCPLTGRYFEPCTSLTESKIYNNRLSEAKIRKLHILVKC